MNSTVSSAGSPSPQQRRDNLRQMVADGYVTLPLAADMARDDPAIGSLKVMPLLRAASGAKVAQARYAFAAAGLSGQTCLRDIDGEVAAVLLAAAVESFDEAPTTLHYPFWDEPAE